MKTSGSSTIPIVISIAFACMGIAGGIICLNLLEKEKKDHLDTRGREKTAKSAAAELKKKSDSLAELVTGREEGASEAASEGRSALATFNKTQGGRTPKEIAPHMSVGLIRARATITELEAKDRQTLKTKKVDLAKADRLLAAEKAESVRALRAKADRIAQLDRSVATLNTKRDRLVRDHSTEKALLNQNIARANGRSTRAEKKVRNQRIKMLRMAAEIKSLKDALGRETTGPVATDARAFTPDGKISVIGDQNLATIDIGDLDGVKHGMVFQVFYKENNKPILKSMGIVKEVPAGQHIALISLYPPEKGSPLLKTIDHRADLPVVEGDYIASMLYVKGKKPTFYLSGTFSTATRWGVTLDVRDLKRKILDYGGEITDTLSSSTDFMIIGDEATLKENDIRIKAKTLNIKVIVKADVWDFLASPDS